MPEEPGVIITIAEVKTLLQITDSSKDALITLLIPIAESNLLGHLNNVFDEDYPPGLKGYLVKMIGYDAKNNYGVILSETVARYSVTYKDDTEYIAGYPSTIMSGLERWRKVKWK